MNKISHYSVMARFIERTNVSINTFASLNLIGSSEAFLQALRSIDRFSAYDATVLILGETGTGKTKLAARAIHYLSNRRDGPFVPVNWRGRSGQFDRKRILRSRQGAFTDARESGQGLVMQPKAARFSSDEIESMTLRAQECCCDSCKTRNTARLAVGHSKGKTSG